MIKISYKYIISLNILLIGLLPFRVCISNNYSVQLDKKYGHAQSEEFINAIYERTPQISQQELNEFHKFSITTDNKHFVRLGGNSGSSSLIKIKNISYQPTIRDAIIACDTETKKSKRSIEMAFGYIFKKFYIETELLITQNMKYYKPQLFNNQNGSLDSVVKSKAIFINGYYDVIKLKSLRFFAGIGLGAGIISTQSRFFNSPVITTDQYFNKTNIVGSFNLTLGCNLKVASQLMIRTAVRYIHLAGFGNIRKFSLGNIIWKDHELNLYLKGQHKFFGVSLSIVHVIC